MESDALRRQRGNLDVIGTDGCAADEAQPATGNQCRVDRGHRADQQGIGVADRCGINGPARAQDQLAKAGKELADQRNVLVSNQFQGSQRPSYK